MRDTFNEVCKDFTTDSTGKDKQFTLIHVSGCHSVPYDDNLKTAKGKTKTNINVSLRNSFKIIGEYIDEMKKAGVYEDSTIIITGDHGYADDNLKLLNKPKVTTLLVKPSGVGEGVAMTTNTAQVSHANLWGTIFQSEGISFDESVYGKSVFDVPENEPQTRKYVWHRFVLSHTSYTENIYEIKGSGKNFDNWSKISTKEAKRELYD
jgi:phosphoglycerol transferase MdoB-like AlkP superfamily enzyme